MCWCYVVVWLWWYGIRMQAEALVLQPAYGPKAVTRQCRVTAFSPDTHPSYLHLTSNQEQLENQTIYVVTNAIVVSS